MNEAGRKDFDALFRFRQVRPGEPVFHMLGRDQVAADTIRDWASRAYDAGASTAIVESALRQADRFEAYGPKAVPDLELPIGEAKQLEYQFARRAWNARLVAKSPEVMFAERRGFDQALGRLRLTETHLNRLQAAALESLRQGVPTAALAAAAAAAGVHLSAIGADVPETDEAQHG